MLLELNIQNLAIIENMRIKFEQGLTVLSGEEGSGKSLIIDALGILLGTRASAKLIRNGENQARIEAVFHIDPNIRNKIADTLKGIDIISKEDDTIVICKEIYQHGRTISRINDHAIPQSYLKAIGQCLVDIHGQLDYISLLDTSHQLKLLDDFGNLSNIREKFNNIVERLRASKKELAELDLNKSQSKIELLRFQTDEIAKANIKLGEEEELIQKLDILQNSESFKSNCNYIFNTLYGDDRSASVLISEALSILSCKFDNKKYAQLIEILNNCLTSVEDIANEFRGLYENTEVDTTNIEEIEQRLNLLNTLKRKYGPTLQDVLKFYEDGTKIINEYEESIELKNNLSKLINSLEHEAALLARELSQQREKIAKELSDLVNIELKEVGLSLAKFEISLLREEANNGLHLPDGKSYHYTREGIDKIEFMIQTNPGEPIRPLRTIASGGETSRIMLALKSTLKKVDPIPTLVFDEIDAGIGGRNADNIGKKLSLLSKQHQVICITHLPQIACFADQQIKLTKDLEKNRIFTKIEYINGSKRIIELAEMLGMNSAGETMLKSAEKLLSNAQKWKNLDGARCTVNML